MKISANGLILVLIDANGGEIRGRTLIQKQSYFISQLMNIDLGFSAHFYGPYSQLIDQAITHNKALDFIKEKIVYWDNSLWGIENKRYDYSLTKDGEIVLNEFIKKNKKKYNEIKRLIDSFEYIGINNDYMALSIAAKVHYIILNTNVGDFTNDNIKQIASRLGWEIDNKTIDRAVNYLSQIYHVQKKK